MLSYILLAALLLVGPFALYRLLEHETFVETVKAQVACISLLGRAAYSTEYDIFNAYLPDGKNIMLEVDRARASKFSSSVIVEATLTFSRSFFGSKYVSSVQWPGEIAPAHAKRNGGLFLSLTYLMLGLGATVFAVQPGIYAELGHWGTSFSGVLTVLSGFALAMLHFDALPANARVDMLSGLIKLGDGRFSMIIASMIACAATALCYYYGGLGLLVGLNLGCAAGMLLGFLAKQVMHPSSPTPSQTQTMSAV